MAVAKSKVDQSALRTNQAFIIALTLVGFVLDVAVGQWIVLFVALVLTAGTIYPPVSLFVQVYKSVLKPAGIVKPDVIDDEPNAHRFAQGVGAAFLLASFAALFFGGSALAGWILAWIVIVLAAINIVFGFCAGCFVYFQLGRLGLRGGQTA